MSYRRDVQLRSLSRMIIEEGRMRPGQTFWTGEARAKLYIEQRVAEPVGAGLPGPSEAKPMEPAEKKPSSVALDGPSTDSPKSSVPGTAQLLFASAEGPASPPDKPRRSRKKKDAGPGT